MKINKIRMLEANRSRAPSGVAVAMAWALAALGQVGCGPATPQLPPTPPAAAIAPGDPAIGAPLLRDRTLGRSGLACADCHAVDAPRPAPPLSGATADGVSWCVERYLRRPALDPTRTGHLLAAAQAAAPASAALPSDGDALYAQQCAGCHEGGPAEGLRGRPWSDDALRARIRGADRPPHPDSLMPPFPVGFLDDPALDRLVRSLERAARAR